VVLLQSMVISPSFVLSKDVKTMMAVIRARQFVEMKEKCQWSGIIAGTRKTTPGSIKDGLSLEFIAFRI
jgi:hypothetical protein